MARTTTHEQTFARPRRGITLLEVLIATFVLAVGLLSVAALIPAGKQQMIEASKFDRSTVVARAALHELKVRRFLDWRTWRNYQGFTQTDDVYAWFDVDEPGVAPTQPLPLVAYGGGPPPSVPGLVAGPPTQLNQPQITPLGPLGRGNSVCIDPLMIGNYPGNADVGVFPYPLKSDPWQDGAGSATLIPDIWPNPPRMSRITLSRDGTGVPGVMTLPFAKRIFTWQDELVFSAPSDNSRRPRWATVVDKGGSATSQTALARATADDYSWFATVVPADNQSSTAQQTDVIASVAVVYKRDLEFIRRGDVPSAAFTGSLYNPPPGQRPAPQERIVFVDVLGSGLGGGEMRLRIAADTSAGSQNNNPAQPDKSDFPAVRIGQWIMLCAWTRLDLTIPAADYTTAAIPPTRTAVFRWYRVTSAGQLQYDANLFGVGSPQWFQNVTLSGPDWNPDQFLDFDAIDSRNSHSNPTDLGDPAKMNGRTATAIIVQGVVAVYEQSIRLE